MKKLLAGCLIVAALGLAALGVAGYFGYRAVATLKLIQAPLLAKDTAGGRLGLDADLAAASGPAPIPEVAEGPLKAALETLWASVAADRARR